MDRYRNSHDLPFRSQNKTFDFHLLIRLKIQELSFKKLVSKLNSLISSKMILEDHQNQSLDTLRKGLEIPTG